MGLTQCPLGVVYSVGLERRLAWKNCTKKGAVLLGQLDLSRAQSRYLPMWPHSMIQQGCPYHLWDSVLARVDAVCCLWEGRLGSLV